MIFLILSDLSTGFGAERIKGVKFLVQSEITWIQVLLRDTRLQSTQVPSSILT